MPTLPASGSKSALKPSKGTKGSNKPTKKELKQAQQAHTDQQAWNQAMNPSSEAAQPESTPTPTQSPFMHYHTANLMGKLIHALIEQGQAQQAKMEAESDKRAMLAERAAAAGKDKYAIEHSYGLEQGQDWLLVYWELQKVKQAKAQNKPYVPDDQLKAEQDKPTEYDENGNTVLFCADVFEDEAELMNHLMNHLDLFQQGNTYQLTYVDLKALTRKQIKLASDLVTKGYLSKIEGKQSTVYMFTEKGLGLYGVTFEILVKTYQDALTAFSPALAQAS